MLKNKKTIYWILAIVAAVVAYNWWKKRNGTCLTCGTSNGTTSMADLQQDTSETAVIDPEVTPADEPGKRSVIFVPAN